MGDAIRATCLRSGVYELGGQIVFVDGRKATLEEWSLSRKYIKTK